MRTSLGFALIGTVVVAAVAAGCSSSGSQQATGASSGSAAKTQAAGAVEHVRVALAVPFTADLPKGWTQTGHAGISVNLVSPQGPYVGVGTDPAPAPGAAEPMPPRLNAQQLADWVASRQYLQPTTVVATTFSKFAAWQVDIRLRDDASATSRCDGNPQPCVPLIRLPSVTLPLGPSHGAVARVIFVLLPSGRTMGVVASGASADDLDGLLDATQPVLDSITFDANT